MMLLDPESIDKDRTMWWLDLPLRNQVINKQNFGDTSYPNLRKLSL